MLKRPDIRENLHILIIEDKGKKVFLAHCLDMDIAAQGKTDAEALAALKELIATQIEYCLDNDMLDTLFRLAPKGNWDMFYRAHAGRILSKLSLNKNRVIKSLTTAGNLELVYA